MTLLLSGEAYNIIISRDGYRTECEDPTRKFYIEEETIKFQGIESQFPVFLAIIAITGQYCPLEAP